MPLAGLLLILGGVRGRRAAANLGVATAALTLADALLVGWARFGQKAAYNAAYQWINVPVSFTGDQRFQGFGVDLSIRLDHPALAALVVVAALFLACLVWHRFGERAEPGPVRYQVHALLLLLSAGGVIVSGDIAEQLAFWLVGALASYLLLGHRWGTEAAGRASRVALALPFLGDVSLLCAVALLYSRFASLDLEKISPALHSTPGVGLKSLTAAALLVLVGVAARAAVWPFTAWQTATARGPASISALVAGAWPVMAGVALLRYAPLFGAAGPQAGRAWEYGLTAAAVLGPLLALLAVDVRRALVLTGSGAAALALAGVLHPGSSAAGLTALLAVGAGRGAGLLAVGSITAAMRTADLRLLGGAWERMRGTSLGLLYASLGLVLAAGSAAASQTAAPARAEFAAGLLLCAVASFRVYFAVGHGPLRRRRSFEPARVREAPSGAVGAVLAVGGLALVGAILAFFTAWLAFLRPGEHAAEVRTDVPWLALLLAGLLAAALALLSRKDQVLGALGRLGERYGAGWRGLGPLYARFWSRPGLAIVGGVEFVGLPAAESGLGRALLAAGGLAGRRLPWVAAITAAGVVLAILFAVLSPGVAR